MEKDNYIKGEILKLRKYWLSFGLVSGAFVFSLLSLLDYFVVPQYFSKFLLYRVHAALWMLLLHLVNRKVTTNLFQNILLILTAALTASTVEIMILNFGGHQSPYYAGIVLTIIFMLGFIPLSFMMSIIIVSIIYSIYFFPILLSDNITNVQIFVNNNTFLIATASITLAWRYFNQKVIVQNLSLEYDLSEDKKRLELYSSQLQTMVAERTKELHESEQWHRSLFENATDGIIVMNRHGIIVNANDRACEMHGFSKEALIGAHIQLLVSDGDKNNMPDKMRQLLDGESLVFEARNNKKDGSTIHVEISAKAITIGNEPFVQSFYRDITEKKKFQEHLMQSQKMESIGLLAGGIAHDFNNVLSAIIGHTDLIRRLSVLNEKAIRSLNVIEDASRRAGRMISKLLGFARKGKYERAAINLNDVVYDTIKLLEQVIKKNIELRVELDHRLPLILGDVNQMEQVIMNFIVNARDAMPNAAGCIIIKTQSKTVGKGTPGVPPYVPPGEYVQISISDTGTGIPEKNISKIFEPFFTTKEKGKGTGLGLSMVYGAISDHEGYLSVQSTLGVGSVFTVFLPAAPAAAPDGSTESFMQTSPRETLLVVDDDQVILDFMREALEYQGYRVFATGDSSVAMDIYRKTCHDVALVITDIMLPGIDGRELIRQIKVIKPDVKVLAISGYARYNGATNEIKEVDGFLQKPFESFKLLSIVRRILDTKSYKSVPTR